MCISYLFTFFVRPGGMRVMTMDGDADDCLFICCSIGLECHCECPTDGGRALKCHSVHSATAVIIKPSAFAEIIKHSQWRWSEQMPGSYYYADARGLFSVSFV